MTVLWGDTGKAAHGTFRTINVNQPVPRETLDVTPTSLPATKPVTEQISFTIQQSDLPTGEYATSYAALVIAGGKNTDAASQTVNFQVYQNGVSKGTGSQSVAANTFWTQSYYYFYPTSLGDTITVFLWATSANVNYDYYAVQVHMTRVLFAKKDTILKDFIITFGNDKTPTLGTPVQFATGTYSVYPLANTGGYTLGPLPGATITFDAIKWSNLFNIGQSYLESNASTNAAHATNRPYYRTIPYPKTITFREVLR